MTTTAPSRYATGDQTEAQRVAAGAAFLDEREPGWWRDIDLDRLDLSSPCRCVLGQLHTSLSDEWDGICEEYGVRPWNQAAVRDEPSDYDLGFNAVRERFGEPPTDAEYDALANEWALAIRDRRAAALLAAAGVPT